MRTALAILLTASLAHGQAADAPTLERPAMTLKAGEIVPFDGVYMDDAKAVSTGKRIAACEAEMAIVETKTVISTPLLVGGIAAIIAVAFAAGAATAMAVKR